ncbi:MAG: acyltransferase [Mucispirillum sp.]|nr:acyltransferase [Mucispirillum sp.]
MVNKHTSFYSTEELKTLGFKSIGNNCLISKKASFYNIGLISIGNNVRIDDFCILSGNITLCSNIHIAAYSALYGEGSITLKNYSGVSPRCTIFSATDDFSGEYMVGAVLPDSVRHVIKAPVTLEKYTQVGAGSIILPGVTFEEGAVCGAMSFINKSIDEWSIYAGTPAVKIKDRSKQLIEIKRKILDELL